VTPAHRSSSVAALRVTFLGTGTSHGVPAIGCGCGTCLSEDPRDQRWRPSILIGLDDGTQVLVDTSPDLRAQALRFGVSRVDALVFTHSHADHILGFDEVRQFNRIQGAAIPCYGDESTLRDIRRTFAYAFDPDTPVGGGVPSVRMFTIDGPFVLGRDVFVPIALMHGTRPILGYRVGSFAYLTDCSLIPDGSWPLLAGVETAVIDALRPTPHPTHFSLAESLETAARLGAARTYFTHMSHDLPHAYTCAQLPRGIELAYDGLVIEIR
jgi:phosphoribosyl 1,2-cyclic phosphate phosphodiesterase